MRIAYVVGLLLLLAGPAAAQSVEETVAFLVLGLEDGAPAQETDQFVAGAENWQQAGDNPLTFKLRAVPRGAKLGEAAERAVELSASVKQSAPCVFELSVTPTGPYWMWMSNVTLDFNKARSIEEFQVLRSRKRDGARSIRFDAAPGFCTHVWEGKTERCMGNFVHHLAGVEERRIRAAFAHLRQRYCAGRAF